MSRAGKTAPSPELCHGNPHRKNKKLEAKEPKKGQEKETKPVESAKYTLSPTPPPPPAANELPGQTHSGWSLLPAKSELSSSSQDTLVGTWGRAQCGTEGAGSQQSAERVTGGVAFLREKTPRPWRWGFLCPLKTRSSSRGRSRNTHQKPTKAASQVVLPKTVTGMAHLRAVTRRRLDHRPAGRSSPGRREESPKKGWGASHAESSAVSAGCEAGPGGISAWGRA